MPSYDNLARRGLRSSTSADPRKIEEDLSAKIDTLSANQVPLLDLMPMFAEGPTPKTHKVETELYDEYDCYDTVTSFTATATKNYARLGRIELAQTSRPTTADITIFHPQDKFKIVDTGQTVMVVMTETERLKTSDTGTLLTITDTALTGNTTTAAAANSLVVRNVAQEDLIPIPVGATVIYMGRTIHESQPIEAEGMQFETYYTCNFVEHKEAVVKCTEDWYEWVQTKGATKDFTFQQEKSIARFKEGVHNNLMWGDGAVDLTYPNRAARHMYGLIPSIHTNVATYNPNTVASYEDLVRGFLIYSAFRYSNGKKVKIAMCGTSFIDNFELAFKEYRRSDLSASKIGPAGLSLDTFKVMDYVIKMQHQGAFRVDTPMTHWCLIVDPMQVKRRMVKQWKTRWYQNSNERDKKFMVEWQGTLSYEHEQHHALLRTPT